jgi:hypothetical protein
MRRIAIATLAALVAACTSAPSFTEPGKRAAAMGKSKQDVLAEFGEPSDIIDEGDQQRLVYVYDRIVLYGPSGPATATAYYCEVIFHLAHDRVTAVGENGPDCGT